MAVNFPDSPTNGDTHAVGNLSYVYNSTTDVWEPSQAVTTATIQISDTPPATAIQGELWHNSSDMKLYVYYNDGTSSQWVVASPQIAGPAGPSGPSANLSAIAEDILPDADSSRSLGSASKKWKDLFLSGDTISLGGIKLKDAGGSLKVETSAGADVSPSGTKIYANLAAFPASGNVAGDMGFATDTKAIYVWDGTEWDRIYSGPQEMVEWSTASNSSYNLITGDSSTTISVAATDPDGFGVTYDYLTNPSNPSSATIVQGTGSNTNDFSITPDSATIGNFSLRITASDGVSKVSTVSAININTPPLLTGALTNGLVAFYDAGDAQSYSGTGSTWSDLSSNGYDLTLATDGSMVYNSSGTGSKPSFTLGQTTGGADAFDQFLSSHNYSGTGNVFFIAIMRHPISQAGLDQYGLSGFLGRPGAANCAISINDNTFATSYSISRGNQSFGVGSGSGSDDVVNVASPGSQSYSDYWVDGTQLTETVANLTPSRLDYHIPMELDGSSSTSSAGGYTVDTTKRDQFHSVMFNNVRLDTGMKAATSTTQGAPTGIELRAMIIYDHEPTNANRIAIHNVYKSIYGTDMASAP